MSTPDTMMILMAISDGDRKETTTAKMMTTTARATKTARTTTTARTMTAVAAGFLPKRQQSTKCGSRRNGSGDSDDNGKCDGDRNNVNEKNNNKEDNDGEGDDDGKEDDGGGGGVPSRQTPIN